VIVLLDNKSKFCIRLETIKTKDMKTIFYLIPILFTITIQVNAQCWQKIASGYNYTLAIKTDGTLWAWGNNFYVQLGDGTNTNQNQLRPCQGCSFYQFS
jgi:alpha-tubulin suppressor-like RCC1 family protein